MTRYEPGDVVEVPFPFIDAPDRKLRPALVLTSPSFQQKTGACVLVMVTSAERSRWDNDLVLQDWAEAGLRKASLIRWKVFTLEETLIVRRRGSLSETDRKKVAQELHQLFPAWL